MLPLTPATKTKAVFQLQVELACLKSRLWVPAHGYGEEGDDGR
jgi:hypothetical protein